MILKGEVNDEHSTLLCSLANVCTCCRHSKSKFGASDNADNLCSWITKVQTLHVMNSNFIVH